MKKPLSPVVISATALVCIALLAGIFLKFGSDAVPSKSDIASPYKIGDRPTSPGSGVNSLTGEPLTETARAYEEDAYKRNASRGVH